MRAFRFQSTAKEGIHQGRFFHEKRRKEGEQNYEFLKRFMFSFFSFWWSLKLPKHDKATGNERGFAGFMQGNGMGQNLLLKKRNERHWRKFGT